MSNHVYKKVEITGSSQTGLDDAIKNGVAKASKSIRNMDWFEVTEMRGHIDKGEIAHWQVTMKIGFRLED
jgi:flavin-binding protein dodecin